jgi:uncharacterized protein YegJ (DUF2314 family)
MISCRRGGRAVARAVLLVALGSFAGAACKRKAPSAVVVPTDSTEVDAGAAVPAGDLRGKHFSFQIGLYLPTADADPMPIVRRLTQGKALALVTQVPDAGGLDAPSVLIKRPRLEDYAPPSAESLRFMAKGLSDAEQRAVLDAKGVVTLSFAGSAKDAVATYRLAIDLAASLAAEMHGVLWDDETRQVFSGASWRARLVGWDEPELPNLAAHIVIHTYRDGELYRLVTLGMAKFALPDVSVNQVAAHDSRSMGTLVDLLCQSLFERSVLDRAGTRELDIGAIRNVAARALYGSDIKDGGTRTLTVDLAISVPQRGDANNPLLEIVFRGPAGALQERQSAALTTLFGAKDDIAHVKHDDALLAASARARRAAIKLKPLFAKGAPQLEHLLVKGPFKTPTGGNEWMWLEVVRWEGTTIHGILDSDPYEVPNLKAGARVEMEEDVIFDYIYVKADGTKEGNETSVLLEQQR